MALGHINAYIVLKTRKCKKISYMRHLNMLYNQVMRKMSKVCFRVVAPCLLVLVKHTLESHLLYLLFVNLATLICTSASIQLLAEFSVPHYM